MKKLIFALAPVLLLVLVPKITLAHSGRTNSEGCHNCNVGSCAGTYHCHNGGSYTAPQPQYVPPIATVKPATPKPATPRPTTTPTETPSPEVLSVSTEAPQPTATPTSAPVKVESSQKDNVSPVVGLGSVGLIAYLVWRARKNARVDKGIEPEVKA
ncbi:hypothetical protein A2375_01965 [Candidatus Woesebacteria bacterium RIFOXYB1_FULL_31_120]|nr:MAG: hypothetical protein A2375_01965 [Candidatus Woesebacteria bacterium RIFOXYB1_FULL_31_120]